MAFIVQARLHNVHAQKTRRQLPARRRSTAVRTSNVRSETPHKRGLQQSSTTSYKAGGGVWLLVVD